jgi:hypothetical protein
MVRKRTSWIERDRIFLFPPISFRSTRTLAVFLCIVQSVNNQNEQYIESIKGKVARMKVLRANFSTSQDLD